MIPKKHVYLAAYIASADVADLSKDLAEIKELVTTSDGAWRLADAMRQAGINDQLVPGLLDRAGIKNEDGRKPDGETDRQQTDNTTPEEPNG